MSIVNLLKGNGLQDCLILGCGPSIKDYTVNQIEEFAQGKTVLAIKQALNVIPSLTSIHFINDNNFQEYKYAVNTIVIGEVPGNVTHSFLTDKCHYCFCVKNNVDFSQSLSCKLDFDNWTIEKEPENRPWGPGIMYELVLFFAHYLGCKNLYTLGWDLGPPDSRTRDHYYSHKVINPAAKLGPDEANHEINLTREFYLWLKSQGVNLSVLSKNSYVHEDVPRVSL